MTKKALLILAILAFVATGAFGQIVIGVTGNQYAFEDVDGNLPSLPSVWNDFKEGVGTYWGLFGEVIFHKLGIGLAFNYQDVPDFTYNTIDYTEMWSYDANVYLSYHILGGRSFLDPFLQAGLGINAYDFKDQSVKDVFNSMGPDDPLFASPYWDFGAGLGINLGGLGIFLKGAYIVPMDSVLTGTDWSGLEYDIQPWYLNGDFKYTFGAKIIL
jgi:hypothetical protein